MKKSIFLLGLLTVAGVCLSACGSKNYEMSFEDALKIANHSELQEILLNAENFEQNLDLSTNFVNEWAKTSISIHSNSKQNIKNYKSESTTTFDVDIDSDDSKMSVDWNLDIKLVDNVVYLNLESLDITGSQDATFLAAMVEWFKNQWFFIAMNGLDEISGSISQINDFKKLQEKADDVIVNEWFQVYSWKFSQFNGYNAYKISLDTEKLQNLIDEYFSLTSSIDEANEDANEDANDKVNEMMENILTQDVDNEERDDNVEDVVEEVMDETVDEAMDESQKTDTLDTDDILDEMENTNTPKIDIQNFEWYLIITGKNKVTTVIENMDIVVDEVSMNVKWFVWEDVELNMVSNDTNILSLSAKKKSLKYDISILFVDYIKVEWTISPKLSTNDIAIKFDVNLTIKSQYEEVDDTIIPLKGSWTYNSINDFSVTAPENSQDLIELMNAAMWWMMEMNMDGEAYNYDDEYLLDYEDNYLLYDEYLDSDLESLDIN